jgi:hypothetical protein
VVGYIYPIFLGEFFVLRDICFFRADVVGLEGLNCVFSRLDFITVQYSGGSGPCRSFTGFGLLLSGLFFFDDVHQ